MKFRRLISVDPSLTCSGWAFFSLRGEKLLGIGKIHSLPPSEPLATRLLDLQQKITELFERLGLGAGDILICEGETTMRDPRAAIKVERVRSIFEAIARVRGVVVPGRINPRSVQSEIMGLRGRQPARVTVKAAAVSIVQSLYGPALAALHFETTVANLRRHQDIVDAILVGNLALVRVQSALRQGESIEVSFSPQRTRRRSSRFGWGQGEANSFGWTVQEIERIQGRE